MSALSIVDYSSTSEESDADLDQPHQKKPKLQLPDLSNIPVVSSEVHLDDPSLHGGRIRSFPHVRGNWASFVFIKYSEEETLYNICDRILAILSSQDRCGNRCDDFHISLSKTVVLQYHQISSFKNSLREAITDIECFNLDFNGINVFCNEDNSRTFISLEVDHLIKKKLMKLTQKVDRVLEDFKLPTFYEDPSFHMSLLWFNGNKKTDLKKILKESSHSLSKEIVDNIKPVTVSALHCKIGNKYFQFGFQ